MEKDKKSDDIYLLAIRGVFWVFCVGVFAFASVMAWPVLRGVIQMLAPFLLGLVLAYIFHPIVVIVQERMKLGRTAGILVTAGLVLLLFGGFFAILVPILYQQVAAVIDALSGYFTSETVDSLLVRFLPEGQSLEDLKQTVGQWFEDFKANMGGYLEGKTDILKPVTMGGAEAAAGTFSFVFSFISWLVGFGGMIFLSLIVAFYILADMSAVPAIVRRLLPRSDPERMWDVLLRANQAVGGFLRGQLIACTGVGILASLILFFIGLKKYAILIGFMAGAVNFIPYLGPTMGAAPAILWAVFTGDLSNWSERGIRIGLILGGFALIQAIDGFVFQPFIVGKQAALHPLTVMLALVIGAQFGVIGMVLAVPVACVAQVFFVEFFWKNRKDFAEEAASND